MANGNWLAVSYLCRSRVPLNTGGLNGYIQPHGKLSNIYRNNNVSHIKSGINAEVKDASSGGSVEERRRKVAFLRTSTGKGTQECYDALTKAEGDLNAALAIINQGIDEYVASADGGSKTQIIDLLHGRVATVMSPKLAVLLEVRCETDFVSRNNLFLSLTKSFANAMHKIALDNPQLDIDADTIGEKMTELRCVKCSKTAKETAILCKMQLHEKIIVTRLGFVKAGPDEFLTSYLHGPTVGTYPLNMVGAAASNLLFKLNKEDGEDAVKPEDLQMEIETDGFKPETNCCLEGNECIYSLENFVNASAVAEEDQGYKRNVKTFVKQIVQHIVGARPVALTLDDYDPEKVAEVRQEVESEALKSGKPMETVQRIVEGKLRKQFGEFVLLEQVCDSLHLFICDQKWPFEGGKPSVSAAIQDFGKKNKAKMEILQMMQFSVADDLLVYKPPRGSCYYNINLLF